MPKKIRKFVPNKNDHKANDSDLVDKTSGRGKSSIEGEKLDDNFKLKSFVLGKKNMVMEAMIGMWKNQLENLQQTNQMKLKVMIPTRRKIKPKRTNNRNKE